MHAAHSLSQDWLYAAPGEPPPRPAPRREGRRGPAAARSPTVPCPAPLRPSPAPRTGRRSGHGSAPGEAPGGRLPALLAYAAGLGSGLGVIALVLLGLLAWGAATVADRLALPGAADLGCALGAPYDPPPADPWPPARWQM